MFSIEIEADPDRLAEIRGPQRKSVAWTRWFVIFGGGLLAGLIALAAALWQADRIVNTFLPEIQQWLIASTGAQVEIGKLTTGWESFRPRVRLEQVTITADPRSPSESAQARLALLDLTLDISQSLTALTPRFGKLNLQHLTVRTGAHSTRPSQRLSAQELGQALTSHLAAGFRLQLTDAAWEGAEDQRLRISELTWSTAVLSPLLQGELSLTGTELDLPHFWLRPLQFAKIETPVALKVENKESLLTFGTLKSTVADLPFALALELAWPDALDESPRMALHLDTAKAGLAQLKSLLPSVLFSPELKSWIDTAIEDGQTSGLTLDLSGNINEWRKKGLAAFADEKKNRLEVTFPFQNLTLDYLEDWPKLTEASGRFKLQQNRLLIDSLKARTAQGTITDGQLQLPNLTQEPAQLELRGTLEAVPSELHTLFQDGLLKEQAWVLEQVTFPASLVAQFSAQLPLDGATASQKYRASMKIERAAIAHRKSELALTDVTGQVELSPEVIQFTAGKAKWGERVLDVEIHSRAEAGGHPRKTEIQLDGALSIDQLREHLPSPFLVTRLKGGALLSSQIMVEQTRPLTTVTWTGKTTGVGIALHLPAPLLKSAEQAWPLKWEAKLLGEKLSRLQIVLEGVAPTTFLYDGKSLEIDALLPPLTLAPWLELLSTQEKAPPPEGESPPLPLHLRLRSPQVDWRGTAFKNADLTWERQPTGSVVKIQSTGARGIVALTTKDGGPQKLKADFSLIALDQWPWDGLAGPPPVDEPPPPAPWNLKSWPELAVKVDRLMVQDEPLGELRFKLAPKEDRSVIEFARWTAPQFELFTRSGHVIWDHGNGQSESSLDLEINLKQFSRPTPFTKSAESFSASEGQLKLKGSWPGSLNQFALKQATGELNGHLRSGKWTGVKSFIQSLFNTLSLNFEDARKRVMRFSRMTLDFKVEPGLIQVREARALFGSVFAKLDGTLTYPARQLELEALITPAVEDIAEDEVGFVPEEGQEKSAPERRKDPRNILTHRYKVTGTWDDPKISLRGI